MPQLLMGLDMDLDMELTEDSASILNNNPIERQKNFPCTDFLFKNPNF